MKKIISLLVLFMLVFFVSGCGKKVTLNDIADKFNNSSTVKTYKEYGFDMTASVKDNVLTISSTMGEDKSSIDFKLDGKILSNEKISEEDIMATLILIDSYGQAIGYEDGQLAENLNAFSSEIKNYTLNKEGFEFISGEETSSLKIDISKKIPLIDMDKFYLSVDDFDMIKEIIEDNENGNQSGKLGNIAYNVFVSDEESTIEIGQTDKLSDSAYKSILSALEVMYGKEVSNKFTELYPKFVDEKVTTGPFTIETNYQEEDEYSMFKDTKIVLVTINNSEL